MGGVNAGGAGGEASRLLALLRREHRGVSIGGVGTGGVSIGGVGIGAHGHEAAVSGGEEWRGWRGCERSGEGVRGVERGVRGVERV
jgi:hypothetical protein